MRWDSPTPIILTRQGKSLAPLGGCNLAGQLQVSLRDTVFCQAKKDAVGGATQALLPPWLSPGQGSKNQAGKAAGSEGGPCATFLIREWLPLVLRVFEHPHISCCDLSVEREVTAIRRRYGINPVRFLPEHFNLALQVDSEQRRPHCPLGNQVLSREGDEKPAVSVCRPAYIHRISPPGEIQFAHRAVGEAMYLNDSLMCALCEPHRPTRQFFGVSPSLARCGDQPKTPRDCRPGWGRLRRYRSK